MASGKKFFDREQLRPNDKEKGQYNRGGGGGGGGRGGRGRGGRGRGGGRRPSYEQKSRDDTGQAAPRELSGIEHKEPIPEEPTFKMVLKDFPGLSFNASRPKLQVAQPLSLETYVDHMARSNSEPLPPFMEEGVPLPRSQTSSSSQSVTRSEPRMPPFTPTAERMKRQYNDDLESWSHHHRRNIAHLYEMFANKEGVTLKDFTRFMYQTSEE